MYRIAIIGTVWFPFSMALQTPDAKGQEENGWKEKAERTDCMNEVKQPKKPLIFYYAVVLMILGLFNFLAMPWLMERQIQEGDYGTFMSMWMCSRTRLFLPTRKETRSTKPA